MGFSLVFSLLELKIYEISSSVFFSFCIEIVTVLIADMTKSAESDEDSTSKDNVDDDYDDDDAPAELNDDQAEEISKDEL